MKIAYKHNLYIYMEYNENKNFGETDSYGQEPVSLREKKSGNNSLWYWIIAILILGLVAWYGYTAGWFSKKVTTVLPIDLNHMEQNDPYAFVDDEVQAPIDNMIIVTGESFPVQKTLSLKGNLPNGCTYLNQPQVVVDGNSFYVSLTTYTDGDVCTQALEPYERLIPLPVNGLPAGVYNLFVNGKQTTFELEQDNTLDFTAGEDK